VNPSAAEPVAGPGVPAAGAPPLGELLVERGLLNEEQLAAGLAEQERTGEPLGKVLIELGYVKAPIVALALATQHGGLLKTEYGFATGFREKPVTPTLDPPLSPGHDDSTAPAPEPQTLEPLHDQPPAPEPETLELAHAELPAPEAKIEVEVEPESAEPANEQLTEFEPPAPEPSPPAPPEAPADVKALPDEPEPEVTEVPAPPPAARVDQLERELAIARAAEQSLRGENDVLRAAVLEQMETGRFLLEGLVGQRLSDIEQSLQTLSVQLSALEERLAPPS
jgi:hypothetical protein